MALRILSKTRPRLPTGLALNPSIRCQNLAASQTVVLACPPLPSPARALHLHPARTPYVHQQRRRHSTQPPRNEVQAQGGSAVQSFPDPDRPDLFYHLFTPPTSLSSTTPVFALSFLATPPPSILSSTVLGWLPASGEGDSAGLNDFVENESFRDILHEAVQSALRDGADEVQKNSAIQTREGWMHIHDSRNLPALGRIGDPDDIIASVRVENGEIMAETYQPMPSYRLATSDGVLQLTEGLAARLTEILEARVREEQR